VPTAEPTEVKVLLALLPRVVTAVMHTTMMSASITAYSTAVGPSSDFRKLTATLLNFCTVFLPVEKLVNGTVNGDPHEREPFFSKPLLGKLIEAFFVGR
jgi:hypothetical protein